MHCDDVGDEGGVPSVQVPWVADAGDSPRVAKPRVNKPKYKSPSNKKSGRKGIKWDSRRSKSWETVPRVAGDVSLPASVASTGRQHQVDAAGNIIARASMGHDGGRDLSDAARGGTHEAH